MKLALFTDAFPDRPLEAVLEWLTAELPETRYVELGTGGYSLAPHLDRQALRADRGARSDLLAELDSRGFRLAALNVSGNPLENAEHDRALRETIRLAPLLGLDRVVCMSGGRPELSGAAWFPGVEDEIERYWQARVLPYWQEVAALAGPTRLCLELEPGSAVFNVSTFERVAVLSDNIALNLDPSHFFWQSIDPLEAVRRLRDRIAFAHGKDMVLEPARVALDGVLDRTAWRYATVGHGHGVEWWRPFLAALAAGGYDGPVSIEYEDPLVAPEESVVESARVLAAAAAAKEAVVE